MKLHAKNILLFVLMMASAALAAALKPTEIMAKNRGAMSLESIVPHKFADWQQVEQGAAQVINPQQTALLATLYSQTLTRTYVNAQGAMVMLSIAYGENQSDGLALHYPDVCYPAQGFQVQGSTKGTLQTAFGTIQVTRLETELGRRKEPLTYWATIGNKVVQGGIRRKVEQLRYGFNGQIPDGLIFRVSTISADPSASYKLQESFVGQLMLALKPDQRQLLSGLSANPAQ